MDLSDDNYFNPNGDLLPVDVYPSGRPNKGECICRLPYYLHRAAGMDSHPNANGCYSSTTCLINHLCLQGYRVRRAQPFVGIYHNPSGKPLPVDVNPLGGPTAEERVCRLPAELHKRGGLCRHPPNKSYGSRTSLRDHLCHQGYRVREIGAPSTEPRYTKPSRRFEDQSYGIMQRRSNLNGQREEDVELDSDEDKEETKLKIKLPKRVFAGACAIVDDDNVEANEGLPEATLMDVVPVTRGRFPLPVARIIQQDPEEQSHPYSMQTDPASRHILKKPRINSSTSSPQSPPTHITITTHPTSNTKTYPLAKIIAQNVAYRIDRDRLTSQTQPIRSIRLLESPIGRGRDDVEAVSRSERVVELEEVRRREDGIVKRGRRVVEEEERVAREEAERREEAELTRDVEGLRRG
ncbi:hypothetical protein HDV00_011551 [Rhizophlyctis rosea]|nr:hypothetical protein HDV00_011551 [Rhizophlyctis rosea]